MYTISTLLYLVARRPTRIHIVSYYFYSIVELLLKLSTMCKSPLHGPCNYADGVGTIRQLYFIIISRFFETSKNSVCVLGNGKCKQLHASIKAKNGRQTQSQDIVQLYYFIKFRGIALLHTIAFISSTTELNLLTPINHGQCKHLTKFLKVCKY